MDKRFSAVPVCICAAVMALSLGAHRTHASTIVRFDTTLGNIDVRLFDTATPLSVANFLNYVNDGDYVDSFIHRAPPDFVIQGGGFTFPEGGGIGDVPTDPPVLNEPGLTNLAGTLAYAKLGGNPDSATSGWFFSTGDNSLNLDNQNGGFTVFGRVIRDGIDAVNAIASQQVVNAGAPFTTLPVLDTFSPPTIFREDLIFVNSVSVLSFNSGDYNFDGVVDTADFAVWRTQFGNSLRIVDHASGSPDIDVEADGNGDGVVDAADYTVWRDAFLAGGGSVTVIPEPGCLGLAGIALGLLLARRRR